VTDQIDAFETGGSSPPTSGRLRITDEQAQARDDLAHAVPGYRLTRDPGDGWSMIPGRYGRLEHLGHAPGQPGQAAFSGAARRSGAELEQLAAFTDRRLIRARLLAIPGVTPHQVGQEELRVLVTPEAVAPVLQLLRCFRRRRPMPEARRLAVGERFAKARGDRPRGAPIVRIPAKLNTQIGPS
jgi:hypothetical protein